MGSTSGEGGRMGRGERTMLRDSDPVPVLKKKKTDDERRRGAKTGIDGP